MIESYEMTDDLVEGDRVEVTVGAPAHGGHCVARLGGPHGRVIFVRHALPGERVTAEITELHKGYLRADAVEVHEPSPDRVTPPCAFAHPGGCGGCDLQHVSADAQLRWKADVVRDQLTRLAGINPEDQDKIFVRVEPLPTAPDRPATSGDRAEPDAERLLGWRSRVRYAIDALDRPGLLQHRSHQVVPIDRCVIAHPAVQELDLLSRTWPDADALQVVASTGGDVAVLARPAGSSGGTAADDLGDAPAGGTLTRLSGPGEVTEIAGGRAWAVPPEGFWQIHPAAADTLVDAVLTMLEPARGEVSWDLYGGAGLFAAALAARTGARTTVVESSPAGVAAARRNLAGLPEVEVVEAKVDAALSRRRLTAPVDLVVLDPPRAGAGAKVVRAVAAATPRAVAYVACDPAALARDLKTFRAEGWAPVEIRAFDCFPMTQHVECVALLHRV
ncbi:putative RNA methyltransferase [Actinoplanes missouriensis 431]|uniref:Putative RNA methyltransferase n=1 Tax=Actinoplanes missouriensis (strain ATCC 14538 / DSM 43046 / CBS 188.64 / JCM 3121 / NBRC 102363 / NCIMB 12654 / NRRL B-3342 / UNCC 431) TaxID=512565 RepID=I0HGC7_ACTM4|nr:putative RNA methyltransferase [Actinoplanes missouriensis 431]